MRTLRYLAVVLCSSFATIAAAGDFDGAMTLTCAVKHSHDCLPTKTSCESAALEKKATSTVDIDFAKKLIRSPYRKESLPVQNATTNKDSLVLQGGDSFISWSALVDRKTGALTIAIADHSGAFVYFGMCSVAQKN